MNGHRPFFSADPRPENVQNPDPRPENVQNPDPRPENVQNPDPRPENVQNPDPRPENVQNPDPRPENVQNPDPRPENVQNPDPGVAYALQVLQQRLGGPGGGRRQASGGGLEPVNTATAGAKVDYSGHLVVRLSPHLQLSEARREKTLGGVARKLKLTGLRRLLGRHRLSSASSRLVALQELETDAEQDLRQRQPGVWRKLKKLRQRRPQRVCGDEDVKGWSAEQQKELEDREAEWREVNLPPLRSLEQLEATAAASELPPLRSLESYWRIDVSAQMGKTKAEEGELRVNGWKPGHADAVNEILTQLNELDEVDRAYSELAVTDPAPAPPPGDTFAGIQEYLDRSPLGIDALWARNHEDKDLHQMVELIDLEQGWLEGHEDLPPLEVFFGNNRDGEGEYRGHHGAAVLSEVAAVANQLGVAGIAPGAKIGRVASHFIKDEGPFHVAAAIRQAIPRMKKGDVLLLEVQRDYLPTEVDDADFDAIRLATAHGIIVVECAGNGEADLDQVVDEEGDRILDRWSEHFRESGAIMVGAARADLPHDRFAGPKGVGSNHGSRVDCFGYGDLTVTAGYGGLSFDGGENHQKAYTGYFGGTSGAAPMVAGAALIVQRMYGARHKDYAHEMLPDLRKGMDPEGNGADSVFGARLSPWEMRGILADRATGTPQGDGVQGGIGVMPDLRAILMHGLQLVPNLYLRDSPEDTGAVPARRRIGTSPDIIVETPARTRDLTPKIETDEGYVGGGKCAAEDHQIRLRLRNRGTLPVSKPKVSVYWSEVATLVTPNRWKEITLHEELDLTVPAGDTLKVGAPTQWDKGKVAEALAQAYESLTGEKKPAMVAGVVQPFDPVHLCFMAVVEDPQDREMVLPPRHPPYFDWNEFRAFLRSHNNVALRNVHRVVKDSQAPPAEGEPALDRFTLPFFLSGTPDLARVFDFEIVQRLPATARLSLEVPAPLLAALGRGRLWRKEALDQNTVTDKPFLPTRLHLPARPRFGFARLRLVAGARHACRFRVQAPPGDVSRGHSLSIRQRYQGEEVGRIIWRFDEDASP